MNKNNTIEIDGEIMNIQSERYIARDGKLILEIEYSFKKDGHWEFKTKQFVISNYQNHK